jgi:hypothetical protein
MLKGIRMLKAKQNAKKELCSQNIVTKLTNSLVEEEKTAIEMLFTPFFLNLAENLSKQTTCKK